MLKMKKVKLLALLMALLMVLTGLAACGDAPKTDETNADGTDVTETGNDGENTNAASGDSIKLGFIGPTTGDVAVYGIAAKNAVELYIEQFNKNGGIGGKKIELISYDDKGDATEAVNAYNKLVTSDEVVAIIGAITSTPTIAVAQNSVKDNIPIMTPTATHPDVTSYGNNTFRSCFLDPFQGSTMANFASSELKAKTAAIIYNTSDTYSTGLKDSFTAKAGELGLQVVATEGYGKDDVDFRAQLTNIAAQNPDVLFIPEYYNNVYLIASQAKEIGLKATLLGVDGTDGVLSLEGADQSVFEGMYFANHYSTDDPSEIVQNFLTGFKDKYKETPNALAALGYDGAMILINAIKTVADAGTAIDNSPACFTAIIDALEKTDMECVTGHITYDAQNNPVKSCAIIKITTSTVDGKVVGSYSLFGKY